MALSAKRPSRADENIRKVLDEVRATKPEKVRRLNAEIENSLYTRIKLAAVKEERTISEITRELWVEYLSKNTSE